MKEVAVMPIALRLVRGRWFQTFIGGAALFFAAEQALKLTGNPNFVPTVILLGALVVPVAFVTYFYGQERKMDDTLHTEAPLTLAATCFFVGGAIGIIVAGFLEYATLRNLSIGALFGVGVIEEAAKLILPVAIYVRGRYRSTVDGLLFGVATGMGFAALETMGYGLVALIQSKGDVGVLEEVLLVRGLLSPVGHAAWTGIVCGVLWRQRERTGRLLNLSVVGAFVVAILLHAFWDIVSSSNQAFIAFPGYIVIGGISLTLLILRLREARRPLPKEQTQPASRVG